VGAYRLLLAMLVAISHMGVQVAGFNPGVVAVISFLIISGFVMTSLIDRNYNSLRQVPLFYLDRALRLYPQFLLYFVISALVIHFLLPGTPPAAALTLHNILGSLLIVPMGFYMYGLNLPDILPPAWSLGLEMCFYLVIPFLIIFNARGWAFAASLLVFLVAMAGYINTDLYGYRLLPGVLFIFLCGSYLYRASSKGVMVVWATLVMAVLLCLAITSSVLPRLPFNTEVALGLAVGIPAVYLLSQRRYHRLDDFLGNLSYGVFLNHFVVIYGLRAFAWPADYTTSSISVVLLLSVGLSIVSYYYVERPALKLRHAFRAGVRLSADAKHGSSTVA